MNTILALDTATENCSAAVWHQGKVYAQTKVAPQQHAALILKMAEAAAREAGIELKEIEGIAFGRGPGSFTGVRIAAAAAQGLALGLNVPLAGISELKALAFAALKQAEIGSFVIAAIDARMGEVYCAVFEKRSDGLVPLMNESVLKPEAALAAFDKLSLTGSALYCAGTGIEVLNQHGGQFKTEGIIRYPDAEAVLALGLEALAKGQGEDAAQGLPLYVRNEVTWKKIQDQHKPKAVK